MMAVFVFGSNLAGIHGKGAAKYALEHHGAVWGQAEGLQGNSYAIPTKTAKIGPMDWSEIDPAIQRFCEFSRANPEMTFQLTPVGCGLAGHQKGNLVKSLRDHGLPDNVYLTASWITD